MQCRRQKRHFHILSRRSRDWGGWEPYNVSYKEACEWQCLLFEVLLPFRNEALMESFQEQDGHYPSLLVVVPEQVQVVFSLVLKGLGIVCSFAFVTCCVATWHQSEVIFSDFEPRGSFGTGIHGYRCD